MEDDEPTPPPPDWKRIDEENRKFRRNAEWAAIALLILAVLFSCSRIGNPNCVAVGEDRWGSIQEDCN